MKGENSSFQRNAKTTEPRFVARITINVDITKCFFFIFYFLVEAVSSYSSFSLEAETGVGWFF